MSASVLTPEKLSAFMHVLSETANVTKACAAVGISRMTAYNWREHVEGFGEAWDLSMRVGVAKLEDEAFRRGMEGVDKPLTHQGRISYRMKPLLDEQGNQVLSEVTQTPVWVHELDERGNPIPETVKEYSDTLLTLLLKAHCPEKYRERTETRHVVDQSSVDAIAAARERAGGAGGA